MAYLKPFNAFPKSPHISLSFFVKNNHIAIEGTINNCQMLIPAIPIVFSFYKRKKYKGINKRLPLTDVSLTESSMVVFNGFFSCRHDIHVFLFYSLCDHHHYDYRSTYIVSS